MSILRWPILVPGIGFVDILITEASDGDVVVYWVAKCRIELDFAWQYVDRSKKTTQKVKKQAQSIPEPSVARTVTQRGSAPSDASS